MVNELIQNKDFSLLKQKMINGEKFLLSKENLVQLLLNCNDKEFYEILYDKGLLFNFNLIEEAIVLDSAEALETMIQVFAGGWANYEENGNDYYTTLLMFAVIRNGVSKHKVTNHIVKKTNKTEHLKVIAILIKKSFDKRYVENLPLIEESIKNVSEIEDEKKNKGSEKLKIKFIHQLALYETLIRKFAVSVTNLISQITWDSGEIGDFGMKMKIIGKKVMTLQTLKLDLESTIKLEKNKRRSISHWDISRYLNTMLSIHFNMNFETAIKQINSCEDIRDIPIIYPKFTQLTKLSVIDRAIFLENRYFSYNRYQELNMKDSMSPLDEKIRISNCNFLTDFFYNSGVSMKIEGQCEIRKLVENKFHIPSKEEIISKLEEDSKIIENEENSANITIHNDIFQLTREEFIKKYIGSKHFSQNIVLKDKIEYEVGQKLREDLSDSALSNLSKVFSTQKKFEISIQSPFFNNFTNNNSPINIKNIQEKLFQAIYGDHLQKQNDLLKELDDEKKLKKEKEKLKKKLENEKKEKTLIGNKIKLEMENKKKLEMLNKAKQELENKMKIQLENKNKQKMLNKKKNEMKQKLIIQVGEEFLKKENERKLSNNNKKNNNNNINNNNIIINSENIDSNNSNINNNVNKESVNNHVKDCITFNTEEENKENRKNYVNLNHEIYNNLNNYYNQETIEYNNDDKYLVQLAETYKFEKEDCYLDPDIQSEIDEKVTSLVDDCDEYEDENFTSQYFFLGVRTN
ncbi:hypothetical protein RB653_005642 [Dictyostelium firmibasis]|uniref:Uncharacterized protein n=1 Tax=Dictyostelium firmibasis TaxID=79012 RepID=A0AAN7UAJ6_9MYCE